MPAPSIRMRARVTASSRVLPVPQVGRSRSAQIRLGHNAPMPYVSSRHLRLFPLLVWRSPAPSTEVRRQ